MQDNPKLKELVRKRDRCKEALDRAQRDVNEQILAGSPVRCGDIVRDFDGKIFRISSVYVKTSWDDNGKLHDRLAFEFQKKRMNGTVTSWQKVKINTTGLESRVLSQQIKVLRHAQR